MEQANPEFDRLFELQEKLHQKIREISDAVKISYKDWKGKGRPPVVVQLVSEAVKIQEEARKEEERVMQKLGITEDDIAAATPPPPKMEMQLKRQQIAGVMPTKMLNEIIPIAVDNLKSLVSPDWLRTEARNPYRLTKEYLTSPFQLVGMTRIDPNFSSNIQRFAQMILLCEDWLNGAENLDFYSAALLIPELTMLGINLGYIEHLGHEAVSKFERLPLMSYTDVASTIHELLVGVGCLRSGTEVEMLKSDLSNKSPDFRVHDYGPPTVIECKRRLSLSDYERYEAVLVKNLYDSIGYELIDRGLSLSLEVEFAVEVECVSTQDFRSTVLDVIKNLPWSEANREESWGQIKASRLPYYTDCPVTRLYAPSFLASVFNWQNDLSEWDGLIAEIDPPSSFIVNKARHPRCLKWRCRNEMAVLKKSRGVTSLWGRAIQQIPPGEVGIIYISYPEGNSPEIADERTSSIIRSTDEWRHYWWVQVPMTVIGRLYARPIDTGNPDLTENALYLVNPELNDVLPEKYPGPVFTLPPETD